MTSLRDATEALYTALGDVPRPTRIDGCPCCIEDKGIDTLLAKPLRELTPDDLSCYAASAFLTVGDVADYLYFLPRILEIAATEDGWWPSPEVILAAVHAAGFQSWPPIYREPTTAYFEAVFNDLLSKDDSGSKMDSWICALGRLHVELPPMLERLALHTPRLLEFYEENSKSLAKGQLSNGFWGDAPVERDLVRNWLCSEEMQRKIQQGYGL